MAWLVVDLTSDPAAPRPTDCSWWLLKRDFIKMKISPSGRDCFSRQHRRCLGEYCQHRTRLNKTRIVARRYWKKILVDTEIGEIFWKLVTAYQGCNCEFCDLLWFPDCRHRNHCPWLCRIPYWFSISGCSRKCLSSWIYVVLTQELHHKSAATNWKTTFLVVLV